MERTISLLAAALLVLVLIHPATGVVIQTFRPGLDTFVSCDVKDIAESNDGMVAFATSSGISLFDRAWTSYHSSSWDYESGMRDDFLRSLSFDGQNRLWIGYAAGVQTYDGERFFNIDEGLFFQHMPVHAILRTGDDIWIAIGNSGIQRYSNGTWTWIRPFHQGGLNTYIVDRLARDHETGRVYALSIHKGLWRIDSDKADASFEQVGDIPDIDTMTGVTEYPFGGVLLYNKSSIYQYSSSNGLTVMLVSDDLGGGDIRINDVRAAEDATLLIGTNQGMFVVHDHEIRQHISRSTTNLQNNNIVRVFPDSYQRYWFVTPYEAGYYTTEGTGLIPIEITNPHSAPDIAGKNPEPLEVKIIYTGAA